MLDVGCGPGTNSAEFDGLDYLGVDLNPAYIEHARRTTRRAVRGRRRPHGRVPGEGTYDFVLVNSLLHHLDDGAVVSCSLTFRDYVSDDGHIHVIELDLPEQRGIPRMLARSDRGEYPRSLTAWRALLTEHFEEVVFEPFPVPARGPMLWSMVYFKGTPRT